MIEKLLLQQRCSFLTVMHFYFNLGFLYHRAGYIRHEKLFL